VVRKKDMDAFVKAFNKQRQTLEEQKHNLIHTLLDNLPHVTDSL